MEVKKNIADLFTKVSTLFDGSGPRFFKYFGERLVEKIGVTQGCKVLDVAAGRGASLFAAADKVGEKGNVIGIDLSEGMVKETTIQIENLGLKNAKMVLMDAEELTFDDESFHYVLCGFGIFFFPEPATALKEFKRTLKDSGRVGFTTFLRRQSEEHKWLDDIIEKYLPSNCEVEEKDDDITVDNPEFDTEEGLYKILSEAGFRDIEITNESKEFMYKDEEEWWEKLWSHGSRGWLERIPKDKLQELKEDIFEKLKEIKKPEGIPGVFSVLYSFGTK